ncbi:putative ribonuclease H-like domain-containing protein, partial [Tanacetum coccineum]
FIKKDKGDILLVQVYVDDIIFGSTKKSLCVEFEQMVHKRFQMSSMGELTFFLGLQVKQKDDGIFISQDKYVADVLKKFDFATVKTTSTPIETNKALLKDEEAEDVDVYLYRSMIRSLMYLTNFRPDIMLVVCACARDSTFDLEAFSDSDYAGASLDRKSTTGGCQFFGKRLISWQCKKQTIVANFTTEAEYVAAANCCGQVLWIQNQMLDYGFNFMNTKIHIDNESTICIVKNPVFHSKTKHIEIRHHFIRDSYEKRLIQVIKIHTNHNVVDLLTKAFDVSSDEFGVKTGSCKVNAARQDLVLLGEINDVKQIHATVDGKTVVISESSVRSDLYFNDEDGITCLTNETIFENLALMGYESDSDKLTFQKALFSPQWKYLIHTILHYLSSKSTSWNEFSTNIASAVICLANGQKFSFSKLIFDEPFNDIYKTPVHTKKVFTNMKRKGKDFLGRITPLFASMLAPPVVEGESSGQPTKPQPAPSTTPPIIEEQNPTSVPIPNVADEAVFKEWDNRVVRATTTAASLDATQASGAKKPWGVSLLRLGLRGHLNIPMIHLSQDDEGRPDLHELMAIYTKLSDMVLDLEKQKDAQAVEIPKLKNIIKKLERKAKSSIPPPKRRLYKQVDSSDDSLGEENASKQGRNDSNKTEEFNLSDKGSGGTEVFDDTTAAEKDVNAAEPVSTAGDVVTAASVILDIDTARPSNISAVGPSTSTAEDIFEDEMLTIADTLVAVRSTRPRTTSVVIRDVEEEPRRATPVPTVQSQDKGLYGKRAAEQEAKDAALIVEFDNVQARIEADALLAARLQEEEREQFSIDEQARFLVETIAERKRFFAAQRAEQIRNKPPTKTQLRNKMITYLKNMGRYTHSQLKNKSLEEIQKLYEREQKWINDFVPMDSEEGGKKAESSKKEAASSKKRQKVDLDDENVKRQKLEDAAEKEGLKAYLKIVPDEDRVIIGSDLQGNDLSYWKITRAVGSSKFYKVFSTMLEDFDRQDLVDLHRLVKERSASRALEGYDLILWGDLNTMFEPSEEDDVWRNQQD